MKRWILYRHTSPSGKVYIGITFKSVNKRWNGGRGYNPSKETRSKISNSSKGRTHVCSEEARDKIREIHLC